MKLKHRRAVLVVDDESHVRTSLAGALAPAGYDVGLAEDGEHALRELREKLYHVLITDMLMPEKDGVELIMELRPSRPDLKIIAISKGADLLKVARLLGAHGTLQKPFEDQEIVSLTAQVLGVTESE